MDEPERYRSSFIFLQEYFFYQHYLTRVIMGMFNDAVKIPVVSALFFIGKNFSKLTLRPDPNCTSS